MYGDDYEYANSRLAGTVVRHEGEPFFVESVTEGMVVIGAYLLDLSDITEVGFRELNLKPVSLGMCNTPEGVAYLSRLPMRRDWKQGLRKGNFVSMFGPHAELIGPLSLRDTIIGNYPTFQEAKENDLKGTPTAWCPSWAIKEGHLIYKSIGVVGKLHKDQLILDKDFQYLQESLQESL